MGTSTSIEHGLIYCTRQTPLDCYAKSWITMCQGNPKLRTIGIKKDEPHWTVLYYTKAKLQTLKRESSLWAYGSTEPGLKEFTYVSTSMTWAAAKNHCRQNYTDLAMIQDDAENTAVASVISSSTNVWIGLYRVPWVWSNGKISSFFNWAPGEPDNLDGAEHCAWVHENHQWSDESCSFMGPFFCQQSEATPDLV
uniref:C-type lectin domain-containing protein n=1 Tax=Periophthalmus magnuspinnatus TaxID=409849 RepID=A0A3B4AT89_9GOBI